MIETLTKQKLFDTVATHLLTQNEKSLGLNGTCYYRGTKGLKCAVGVLIPDETYSMDMEGRGAREVLSQCGLVLDRGAAYLADFLQALHDYSRVESWKEELSGIAENRGLSPIVLESF